MTKENLEWLDDADEKELRKITNEKVDQIIASAVEKAEQKFEGVDLEQQENADLFNEFVKEYSRIMTGAYTERIKELALAPFTEEEKKVREFLEVPEKFKYGNTKLENIMKKPDTNLVELIQLEGFKTDIASKKDKAKGNNYIVPLTFIVDESVIFPDNFDYTLTNKHLVDMVGNLYDLSQQSEAEVIPEIRADHLVNYMDGKALTTRVRADRIDELTDTINHLRNIDITIDTREHALYNRKSGKKVQFDDELIQDSLLPVGVRIKNGNSKDKRTYYTLRGRPPLYHYAMETGQLINVDYSTLDLTTVYLPDGTTAPTDIKRMSQQVRSIAGLIQQEINGRGRNWKYTEITYQTFYDYLENDLGKKTRRETINNNIEKVADTLIKKGVLKKKSIHSKGRVKLHKIKLYTK